MNPPADCPTPPGQDTQNLYDNRRLHAIASRWDARAAGWDEQLRDPACHLNEDEGYGRFLVELRALLQERRDFCAGHGVVDAGCGTGLVLAEAVTGFTWGLGVDISPAMLHLAEAKHIPRARFVRGDCFHLAELCPPAGAVVSRGVLLSHYGRAAEGLLASAAAALAPGGFVLFDFLNQAGRGRFRHTPAAKAYFSGDEACALARRAGLVKARALGEPGGRVLFLLAEK